MNKINKFIKTSKLNFMRNIEKLKNIVIGKEYGHLKDGDEVEFLATVIAKKNYGFMMYTVCDRNYCVVCFDFSKSTEKKVKIGKLTYFKGKIRIGEGNDYFAVHLDDASSDLTGIL